MTQDELRLLLIDLLSREKREWIAAAKRLPPMYENVLVIGTLSGTKDRAIRVARRWTGYSGPDARHDEVGGVWDWLTEADRHVHDVEYWFPIPTMPGEG